MSYFFGLAIGVMNLFNAGRNCCLVELAGSAADSSYLAYALRNYKRPGRNGKTAFSFLALRMTFPQLLLLLQVREDGYCFNNATVFTSTENATRKNLVNHFFWSVLK